MRLFRTGFIAVLAATSFTGAANAQQQPTVVALPPMTTPDSGTKGNEMLGVAWQATQLIAADLQQTSELSPLEPSRKDYYSFPEVTAPTFSKWRDRGAKALVTGFVQERSDGRYTFGCYVYDVDKGRELDRIGFVVSPDDVRRAAHKCSGLAYKAVTGSPGMFDTRIAYVSESGPTTARIKRIAVMDSDGYDHSYVTPGTTTVLTPRLSPRAHRLAFVDFQGGVPQVRIVDLDTNRQRPLLPGDAMTFAPRYSPDGRQIVFSMMQGANSDIYVVGANGGMPRRLTTAPGVDTDPSFSPDGRQIVFESDRSGTPQLYIMNSDGSNEHRFTFTTASYGSPEWSPDGKRIAFTWRWGATHRIGIINADGSGERVITSGPGDESPSWAASSRELVFQRTDGAGRPGIYRVGLDGRAPRRMTTPQDGSDPSWSGTVD
jgi:TolB protein